MINDFRGEYRFLSNYHPSKVVFEGKEYTTVEHAYQAAKTFDLERREKIQRMIKPAEAKKEGGIINKDGTLRDDWKQISLAIMENLIRQKFCDRELAKKLMDTGDHELVEGNWWGDTFYGVCNGIGENHLGKILMKVRADLNDKENSLGGS